jgi:hypothetical protein
MVAQTTEKHGIICYRKLQFPKAETDIAELKLFKKRIETRLALEKKYSE